MVEKLVITATINSYQLNAMPKPKHIKLLERLRDKGIGVTDNISSFMTENFVRPLITKANEAAREKYANEIRHISLFLRDLSQRSFICIEDSNESINWGFNIEAPIWFDSIIINVYITTYGLDYLDQHEQTYAQLELNKSYKDVNHASIINYRTQRNLAVLTLLLAMASAVYSWRAYNKTDETAMAVERLRLEVKSWRIEQKTPLNQKASVPAPNHK